jgi:hypothetical protein
MNRHQERFLSQWTRIHAEDIKIALLWDSEPKLLGVGVTVSRESSKPSHVELSRYPSDEGGTLAARHLRSKYHTGLRRRREGALIQFVWCGPPLRREAREARRNGVFAHNAHADHSGRMDNNLVFLTVCVLIQTQPRKAMSGRGPRDTRA